MKSLSIRVRWSQPEVMEISSKKFKKRMNHLRRLVGESENTILAIPVKTWPFFGMVNQNVTLSLTQGLAVGPSN